MFTTHSTFRQGLIWAFIGVLVFSFSLPMTKLALVGFDPFVISMGRAAIAGIIAAVLLIIFKVPFPQRRHIRALLFTAAGAVVGWPIFIGLALERTTSSHAAVIVSVMPAVTAAFAVVRHKEITTSRFWVGVGISTVLVMGFTLSRGGGLTADLTADLFIALAVISSAICYVEGAGLTSVMPGWQVISWVVVISLPLTIPSTIGLWVLSGDNLPTDLSVWIGMGYLGLFSMYLGFFAWYRGLALAGVAQGSQIQQLQGLLTLIWSVWLLGETLSWVTMAAAVAVVVAVAWTQKTRHVVIVAPEE
jgi:drug/metabolite transporter (DMT)-like permease